MILGIAGTAKNTGKTTTTNAIIEKAEQVNLRVGLTSIGYDGEDIDHVTDLPKPRVYLEAGNLVAIAEGCLKGSKAGIEVLETTDIRTPIGKIIIGKIHTGGRIVIAGPNKARDLRMIITKLQEHGADLILVDGALNRLAPMVVTDGLVLATGASRTPDLEKLALETGAIYRILNLPLTDKRDSLQERPGITLLQSKGEAVELRNGSLLLPMLVEKLIEQIDDSTELIYVPGVIEEQSLNLLVDHLVSRGRKGELVLHDPIKLLVGGNPLVVQEAADKLAKVSIELKVCSRLPLLLITINPFYPRYRVQYRNYQPDYVDANLLAEAIKAQVPGRVINVMQDGMDLSWFVEK